MKEVKGYEGYYAIDRNANIFRIKYEYLDHANSKKYELPKMLKKHLDKDGYEKVTLVLKGKAKVFFVHRLMAIAYIPNSEQKSQVNHIDGIKNHNSVDNLEWVTQSENRVHCLKYLNPKLKNNRNSKKVIQKTMSGEIIQTFLSAKDAGRITGKSQGHISEVCRGEKRSYLGFIWEYCK